MGNPGKTLPPETQPSTYLGTSLIYKYKYPSEQAQPHLGPYHTMNFKPQALQHCSVHKHYTPKPPIRKHIARNPK